MKKLLTMAVALMMSAATFAQNQEVGTWGFNGQVGLGYGTLSEVVSELDNGIMASFGVNAVYQATENLYVTGGLDYRMFLGDEYKVEIAGFENKQALNFGYLDIPVVAHYTFGPHFGVLAGIQPGFLLSAKNDDDSMKDACKSFNFGIPVGVEWTFNTPITVSAKYVLPCTDWDDEGAGSKMSYFMVTAAYKFGM